VKVLVAAQDDVLAGHASRQTPPFFLAETDEVVLQVLVEGVQSTVGGPDEVVELDQLQEVADGVNAAGIVMMEDEERSENQASQECLAGGTAEEGDEILVQVFGMLLTQPVAQSGTRDAMFLGVGALRAGRVQRVGEVGKCLGGIERGPVRRLWPRGRFGDNITGGHGSCSFLPVFSAKAP
jgi:hypothetical protein